MRPMPISFQHHVLPNGLNIVAEVNPDAHTAAVAFFVKAGARDEAPAVMGVSHFLEHMMFKGTDRRTADDVNREFDELGADYNAFTSHEQTAYYAHVLPEFLPRAVDLLGDMLRPSLRQADFDMEKNVILEEIQMYDDRPEWRLQDRLLEEHYGGHGLGHRVLGTGGETGTVTRLNPQQMRDYFEHRYSPDNTVVSAAGRIDFDALVADIDKLCGHWQPTGAARDNTPPPITEKSITLEDARVSRRYFAMLTPGPAADDDLRYAGTVFADVVGADEGSRLYWALIDPGHADEASLSAMPQDHAGALLAYATCPPADADRVESVLIETIDAAAADPGSITDDELDRAKNKLATEATLRGERPAGRMQLLGMQWLYLGRYIPLEEELARLTAVDRDELAALVDAYPMQPRTTLRLTPAAAAPESADA